jgi:hypothetical protein
MKCKLTWKLKGTKSNRMYFQLAPSTPRTGGIEFGLLPTPRTVDVEGGKANNVQLENGSYYRENLKGVRWGVKLRDVVENNLLPTPTSNEMGSVKKRGNGGESLRVKINNLLPTPVASDHNSRGPMENWSGTSDLVSVMHTASGGEFGKTSQLNPRFVAEMMGFPPNWTELPFQNGEPSPSKPTETP